MNEDRNTPPDQDQPPPPAPSGGEEPQSNPVPAPEDQETPPSPGDEHTDHVAADEEGQPGEEPGNDDRDKGGGDPSSGPPGTRRFVSRRRKGRRFLVTVRYGRMAATDAFISFFSRGLRPGAACVVKTSRGTEFGDVVTGPEEIPQNEERDAAGRVLRLAVEEDRRRRHYIEHRLEPDEMKICRTKVQAHKLSMKVIAAEHVLGGEKIIFYFLAEHRVDFRALVRELAEEFHTRIELRQVGVRDEARIVADCGHCGRPLCCRSFLSKLEPVGMKQAKVQNITDPTKMSGRCGRLMCCLRFEADTYAELSARMPARGTRVTHAGKEWSVVDSDPIGRRLFLSDDENNRLTIALQEIGLPNPEDAEPSSDAPAPRRPRRRPPRDDAARSPAQGKDASSSSDIDAKKDSGRDRRKGRSRGRSRGRGRGRRRRRSGNQGGQGSQPSSPDAPSQG